MPESSFCPNQPHRTHSILSHLRRSLTSPRIISHPFISAIINNHRSRRLAAPDGVIHCTYWHYVRTMIELWWHYDGTMDCGTIIVLNERTRFGSQISPRFPTIRHDFWRSPTILPVSSPAKPFSIPQPAGSLSCSVLEHLSALFYLLNQWAKFSKSIASIASIASHPNGLCQFQFGVCTARRTENNRLQRNCSFTQVKIEQKFFWLSFLSAHHKAP